jgi:hypothetical protein
MMTVDYMASITDHAHTLTHTYTHTQKCAGKEVDRGLGTTAHAFPNITPPNMTIYLVISLQKHRMYTLYLYVSGRSYLRTSPHLQ